jgi:hypothetical protein
MLGSVTPMVRTRFEMVLRVWSTASFRIFDREVGEVLRDVLLVGDLARRVAEDHVDAVAVAGGAVDDVLDFLEADLLFFELVAQALRGATGLVGHRLVEIYAEHHVHAALQVETRDDVRGACPGGHVLLESGLILADLLGLLRREREIHRTGNEEVRSDSQEAQGDDEANGPGVLHRGFVRGRAKAGA